jgi:ABC-type nitrate/sulfonate/bicarbonate transport system substrate-binding protein
MAVPAAHAADAPKIVATELTPLPDPSLAYNRMVQAMGLFAKHDVAMQLGPDLAGGGPERIQALVTNNTDVATSDIIAAMGAVYSGAKVKILMVMTPYGDEEVWGQKKWASMKDALGQTWGVASLGGAQRFNGQMAVQGMGLDPNGFRWVALGGGDGPILQALDSGRTQLGSLSHLGAELAVSKGFAKTLHVLVPHTAKFTPPIPRLVIVAREDWIKANETAATDYVEAMLDAARQWQTNAKSWVTPAAAIYKNSGLNDAQLTSAWGKFASGGYFSVNGGVNYAGTQKVMDLFFKIRNEEPNQYLKSPADIFDTGPLKAALAKMGVVKGAEGLPDNPDWDKSAAAESKRPG